MHTIKTAYLTGRIHAMTKLGFAMPKIPPGMLGSAGGSNVLRNALIGAGVGGLGGLLTADRGEGLSHALGGALLGAGVGAGGTLGHRYLAKPKADAGPALAALKQLETRGVGTKAVGTHAVRAAPTRVMGAATQAHPAPTETMSAHETPTRRVSAVTPRSRMMDPTEPAGSTRATSPMQARR